MELGHKNRLSGKLLSEPSLVFPRYWDLRRGRDRRETPEPILPTGENDDETW